MYRLLSSPSHGDPFGKFSKRLEREVEGVMRTGGISIQIIGGVG